MIFPYQRTESGRNEPIVPLHLKTPICWFQFNAFIDTGADYSVFHPETAKILGLKLEHGKKLSVIVGDGDRMIVYLHTVMVKFSKHVFPAELAFSKYLGAGFNLMGRKSFFDNFRFCFNNRDRIVSVTRLLT